MDLANYEGKQFLISVDQFSMFPHIAECGKTATTQQVVDHVRAMITHYSIPVTIYTDGGPQFKEDGLFDEFCNEWGIEHVKSSPYYPKSNGVAEETVKEMKKIIAGTFRSSTGKLDLSSASAALLMFRNTPRSPTDLSPAQMLFGQDIRDHIPMSRQSFKPTERFEVERRLQEVRKQRQIRDGEKPRELPVLQPGQKVLMRDPHTKRWMNSGSIVSFGENEREYLIRDDFNDKIRRRNRWFLRPQNIAIHPPPDQPVQAPKKTDLPVIHDRVSQAEPDTKGALKTIKPIFPSRPKREPR